jgi:thiol-disulfide isomerase/thioredoxin
MIKWMRLLIFSILLSSIELALSQDHNLLMEGIDGKQHSLSEYVGKGKWVVVNVWATACPHCRRELFDLASFHERHHNTDTIVVGLTLDLNSFGIPDKEYLSNFTLSYLIDYPVLLVSGDLASKVIGIPINTVPMTFFYNPKGEMVYQLTGEITTELLEDIIKNEKPFFRAKRTIDKSLFSNEPIE